MINKSFQKVHQKPNSILTLLSCFVLLFTLASFKLATHAAAKHKLPHLVCTESNSGVICYSDAHSKENNPNLKGKKYTASSLNEIADKFNYYNKPILVKKKNGKSEIAVLKNKASKDFVYYTVDLSNPTWYSTFTSYSWWDSSLTSSSWDSFYHEAYEEYTSEDNESTEEFEDVSINDIDEDGIDDSVDKDIDDGDFDYDDDSNDDGTDDDDGDDGSDDGGDDGGDDD